MIKDKIDSNQNTVVAVAVGVIVVMVSPELVILFIAFDFLVPEYAVLVRHVHHGQLGRWTKLRSL